MAKQSDRFGKIQLYPGRPNKCSRVPGSNGCKFEQSQYSVDDIYWKRKNVLCLHCRYYTRKVLSMFR